MSRSRNGEKKHDCHRQTKECPFSHLSHFVNLTFSKFGLPRASTSPIIRNSLSVLSESRGSHLASPGARTISVFKNYDGGAGDGLASNHFLRLLRNSGAAPSGFRASGMPK